MDERPEEPEDLTRIQKILKNFFVTRRFSEILGFTLQEDLLSGEVEFRLRLARRSGGTTTGDSTERKEESV